MVSQLYTLCYNLWKCLLFWFEVISIMAKINFGNFLDLHKNSLGFIRFFLALAVLYHHSYPLGGFAHEPFAELIDYQEDAGSIAVLSFFIISGFLIMHSVLFSKNAFSYAWRRFLRIMPGFWVCLLVTAFFFGPMVYLGNHTSLDGYWTLHKGPFDYITHNFFLGINQYNIGKLLEGLTTPYIWDGSLWTLILEAKGYIFLGILGLIPFIKKRRSIFLAIFIVLTGLFVTNYEVPKVDNPFIRFFIDQDVLTYTAYFFTGAIFYLYRKEIPANIFLFILAIAASVIAVKLHIFHEVLYFTAPYIIFWLAGAIPFHGFTKFGDFSYGIYIYAYPIQQVLSFYKLNGNLYSYLAITFFITMIFASLSWYLIEKPALSLKKAVK